MLDIKILREDPERVRTALKNRGASVDLDRLLECDRLRRETITEVEELKRQRNSASKEIGKLKSQGEDASEQMQAVRELGDRITVLDAQCSSAAEEGQDLLMAIPNLPDVSVPVGSDESANPVLRTWGEAATFDFEPIPHWDLGDKLGIFDFARAARMSGSGFSMLIGAGSRLSRALVQFMLDLHTTEHGYTEILPPFLANSDALRGTGQLPKFPEEMYHIPSDDLWLIPTAEVPLTNLCREEILEAPLPVALTAYTPCFRREAGAAGKMTRGLNRVHQFDKVEMVRMVDPAQSFAELELLTGHAETVLQRLGLHYRVIELCTGDIGFSSAKTYDLELWAPGQQAWLEVSSCSNFVDFQARRAQIRYRDEKGKPAYVHTLNGSGVALPRLMVAILENGQQADGSVILPEAIRPYMGGMDRIVPPDPS